MLFSVATYMRIDIPLIYIVATCAILDSVLAVESESTLAKRVRKHQHKAVARPLPSMAELLAESAALSKKFEDSAAALHRKVQEESNTPAATEEVADEDDSYPPSFLQLDLSQPLPADFGQRAMRSVEEEIRRYNKRLSDLGNDMFSG